MTRLQTGITLIIIALAMLSACKKDNDDPKGSLQLSQAKAGNRVLDPAGPNSGIDPAAEFRLSFSAPLRVSSVAGSISLLQDNAAVEVDHFFSAENHEVVLRPRTTLQRGKTYDLQISNKLRGAAGEGFDGLTIRFSTVPAELSLLGITINGRDFRPPQQARNIPYEGAQIVATFSDPLAQGFEQHIIFTPGANMQFQLSDDRKTLTINTGELDYYCRYLMVISSSLQSAEGAPFAGFSNQFITGLNPNPKLPLLTDDQLLDLVQLHTFRYFWDYAHPVSGLARERLGSGETVTIGGSGFGLMGIIAGVHRNFISRQQAVSHFDKVTNFLANADRFHGAWPHWLNGSTGRVQAFSQFDNGADLVETSFMAAALLTVRQWLNPEVPEEHNIITRINNLLAGIEWNWFTRSGQNVLYWHWSPNHGWAMNMQVKGYNEALITYFMAATSETYPIEAQVYHQGWASNGGIINNKQFYGINLPVGFDYGGPLFFAHYSFLGLDPRNLSDQYANYWTQNVNHTLINREHCVRNPYGHVGYGADSWGLTASDDHTGYRVHEPTNDNGTITPTAALSSIPFTPEYSMQAMRHFYYILGDKLFGEYGFKDAFNPGQGWFANSYLAIDQGPILVMIENHRSGLLWNLFMSAPEVQTAMNKLGFSW
ncbi:MAG: Ig-like domain-containing protein [Bacteroidetes bacterium]|nr:Ig-like domain-containing protein [Bacteroidota bacterium]